MTDSDIVLVGCGTMGGALLAGWLAAGRSIDDITVIDPAPRRPVDGVTIHAEPAPDLPPPRLLVLAIKPQLLAAAAPGIAPLAGPRTIVVSVLAAVDAATLRHHFPNAQTIVRAVPNLPAAIGKGVTALYGKCLKPADRPLVSALVAPLGPVEWLDAERLIDAATAVSGCGPAFLFRYADAIIRAGVSLGLTPRRARLLIARTMIGTGHMLEDGVDSPAAMAQAVASPGGVTQAGLARLDRDNALNDLLAETLATAAERNAGIAAKARADLPEFGSKPIDRSKGET